MGSDQDFQVGDRIRFDNPGFPRWCDREGTVLVRSEGMTVIVKLDNDDRVYNFQRRNLTSLEGPW